MSNFGTKLFAAATVTAALSIAAQAQSVTTHVMLPNFTTGAIVANPVTNRIYAVSNSGLIDVNDTVSVIDGKTDTLLANISVPAGAYYPAVDILTNKIYVASCNSFLNPAPCFVTVIDGKSNAVVANIPVVTVLNGFLAAITVNPATQMVYVSDTTDGNITVIDEKTNVVTGTISLTGETPYGLTVNPLNNLLYVTLGSDKIDIVNTKTKSIVQASTGAGTVGYNVAVNLLTGHVLVTNTQFGASTTAVLDQNGKLLAQVPVGQAAYGVDVDLATNLAFTANGNDNSTSEIDSKKNTLKATIPGTYASFLSVNPVTRKVYAVGNGMVTVAKE